MSQTDRILADLKAGHALTALEALHRHQCFRLAARIDELRQQGHAISVERMTLPSGKRVARYRMGELR